MLNSRSISLLVDLSQLSCRQLSGVGTRTAERLASLGIESVQDLLFYLPYRYQDRTHIQSINQITEGEHVVVEGEIVSMHYPTVGRTRLLCRLADETGTIQLRFFYLNMLKVRPLATG